MPDLCSWVMIMDHALEIAKVDTIKTKMYDDIVCTIQGGTTCERLEEKYIVYLTIR